MSHQYTPQWGDEVPFSEKVKLGAKGKLHLQNFWRGTKRQTEGRQ
jgi:hypothetical protein